MATVVAQPPNYTATQMTAWLRGLLSIAWADGNFDAGEQQLISELTQELAPSLNVDSFEPIEPAALAEGLGGDSKVHENFLRTAVMVAVADGVYSSPEDRMLQQFCESLSLETTALEALRLTMVGEASPEAAENSSVTQADSAASTPLASAPVASASAVAASPLQPPHKGKRVDVLKPARVLLDDLEVHDPRLARFLCKMIPSQCPFERDVKLFGHKVVHIPPLCKLNPLYEQLVGLRFRALCYLADDLGEDVSQYC